MKGKLIKDKEGYFLDLGDEITKRPLAEFGQLSIKNCQAIENGYDLDELAENTFSIIVSNELQHQIRNESFKIGFQKAIELLGDKKYSEGDMKKACSVGIDIVNKEGENDFRLFEGLLESLQPTEWDVEIKMECPQCQEWGYISECRNNCNQKFLQPKLDSNGCLILKRI